MQKLNCRNLAANGELQTFEMTFYEVCYFCNVEHRKKKLYKHHFKQVRMNKDVFTLKQRYAII